MGKFKKIFESVMSREKDSNLRFEDVLFLMKKLGFNLRIKGSHHILYKDQIEEIINLQSKGHKAKPYQVKQIRSIISKYGLGQDE